MSDQIAKSASTSDANITQLDVYRVLMKLGEWTGYDPTDSKMLACFKDAPSLPEEIVFGALDALRKSGDIKVFKNAGVYDISITNIGAERAKALKQIQEGPHK